MYSDLGLIFPRIIIRQHPERLSKMLFLACIWLAEGSALFGGGSGPQSSWENPTPEG